MRPEPWISTRSALLDNGSPIQLVLCVDSRGIPRDVSCPWNANRESLEREQLMQPGQVYAVNVDLFSTSIIFNKGHRLRLHVTSSSDPGYDPNPNTGEPFRSSDRMRIAANTVHASPEYPSRLILPVPAAAAESP